MSFVLDPLWRIASIIAGIVLGGAALYGIAHMLFGFLSDDGVNKAVASLIRRIDAFFRGGKE